MFELISAEEVNRIDFLFGHLYDEANIDVPAYEMLYQEGNECNEIFILIEGCVALNKKDSEGKYSLLCKKYPGAILGITSLYSGKPYSNTAITTKDSKLIRLTCEEFKSLLSKNRHLHLDFLRPVAQDIDHYRKTMQGNFGF